MTDPRRLVDKLWSYCNVLGDDGVSTIEYTEAVARVRHLATSGVEWRYRLGRQVEAMSLNIKNEQTHRLVQELAAATGETQTAAVTVAVRERLERVRDQRRGDLADRLLAIGADVAARLPDDLKTADHGDLLYDEDGLPA